MSLKRNFFFFSLFLISLANLSFAQDAAPTYTGADTTDNAPNIFLQNNAPSNTSGNTQVLTPAQKFNGGSSGNYDGSVLSCPYAFERDLSVGSVGQDVKLLQVLLNSDKRTIIALNGPGSQGQESTSFGVATKDAVKRFQALFIEYVGVANGRFGPRTRTVMNAICTGDNGATTAGKGTVANTQQQPKQLFNIVPTIQPDTNTTANTNTTGTNTTGGGKGNGQPPKVSLAANLTSVDVSTTFKVIANFSKEITPITPDSVIVDGGIVKEIRKLSKTGYVILVTPNPDAKEVDVQIEAEKITDLDGNTNDNASNEVIVKVTNSVATSNPNTNGSTTPASTTDVNALLNTIVASVPQCNYKTDGTLITTDSTGATINTTGCPATQTTNTTPQCTYNVNGQLITTDTTGKTINTSGCSVTQTGNTYNCNGQQIPNTQACNNNQNQQVCSTTMNPYTGVTQQTCQSQQSLQQQQQAQQANQLGQMLGSLLGNKGFGSGQNGTGANNNNVTPPANTQPYVPPATQPTTPPATPPVTTPGTPPAAATLPTECTANPSSQTCTDAKDKALADCLAKQDAGENVDCNNLFPPAATPPADTSASTNPRTGTTPPADNSGQDLKMAMAGKKTDFANGGNLSDTDSCKYITEDVGKPVFTSEGEINVQVFTSIPGDKPYLLLQNSPRGAKKFSKGACYLTPETNLEMTNYKCCRLVNESGGVKTCKELSSISNGIDDYLRRAKTGKILMIKAKDPLALGNSRSCSPPQSTAN